MSDMSVTVSAPGKVILHGEHSVVYGKVAVAAAIGLRTTVNLQQTNNSCIVLKLQDLAACCEWEAETLEKSLFINKGHKNSLCEDTCSLEKIAQLEDLIQKDLPDAAKEAAKVFLFLLRGIGSSSVRLPRVTVTVSSSLPTGAGLGSSAAYSVTLSAALLINSGLVVLPAQDRSTSESSREQLDNTDLKQISDWAFEAEKVIHGRQSGIDNSISTYGENDGNSSSDLSTDLLTQIFAQVIKVSWSATVTGGSNWMPSVYDSMFEAISGISKECTSSLEALFHCQRRGNQEQENAICECFDRLEMLMDVNQNLLRALGVSHGSLDTVCRVSSKHGLHSKLTGAGGGGCAITLLRHDTCQKTLQALRDELKDLGFDIMVATLGNHGVRVENS